MKVHVKRTAGKVFSEYYLKLLSITKNSPLPYNAEFELLPPMCIVSDYAAASAGKDRKKMMEDIQKKGLGEAAKVCMNFDPKEFDFRMNLYAEVIRGRRLRGDWILSDLDFEKQNAIQKVVILLGDILYNPECVYDYDNSPVAIYDIFKVNEFVEKVMLPLESEFTSLFLEMYEL